MASNDTPRRGVPAYLWAALGALVAGAIALINVANDYDADPMALLTHGVGETDAVLPFYVHCACLVLTPVLAVAHVVRHRKAPEPAAFVGAVLVATISAIVAVLWVGVYVILWLAYGLMGVR